MAVLPARCCVEWVGCLPRRGLCRRLVVGVARSTWCNLVLVCVEGMAFVCGIRASMQHRLT